MRNFLVWRRDLFAGIARLGSSSAFAIILIASGVGTAAANTLEKIQRTQVLSLGFRTAASPMAFKGPEGTPLGYSVDVCLVIAEEIKRHLGLTDLRIKFIEIPSSLRSALLVNGTVDFECGISTNAIEREEEIAFTTTIMVGNIILIWRRENPIRSLADLKAKTVSGVSGSTTLARFNDLNSQMKLRTAVIPTRAGSQSFALMARGEVDAAVTNVIALASNLAAARDRERFAYSEKPLGLLPLAIGIRKNDRELKKIADTAIQKLFNSGEVYKLYEKWFTSPIPPDGRSLGLPMSEEFKRVIANPTDSPDPSSYE